MAIVILGQPFYKAGKTNRYVAAKCECGKVFDTTWGARSRTKSCGCLRPAPSRLRHGHCMKHSGVESSTYRSWRAAHGRCYNPNDKMYHRYGGRGITMCERWLDFANFLADMPAKPNGATIERIDSDKGYEPANCRWATRSEQNRNKSDNRIITLYGKAMCLADWHRVVQSEISYKGVHLRLKRGWTEKEAIFGKG